MATVDVIIPAYNGARYLPYALDSVIAQTFGDWKIVLVDDGSTDNTAEVVAPYAARLGERLAYIRQANAGVSAARNRAIRASDAEFIALLDADDVWRPERLAETVRAFREHPEAGIVYSGLTLMDAEGREGQTYTGTKANETAKVAPLIYSREIHLPCVTVSVRRRCVEEAGLFDESMRATEDRDLWFRVALKYDAVFVPKSLAYYRVTADSASRDPEKMMRGQEWFLRKHYGAPGCGLAARQRALGRVYRESAETYMERRERGKALRNAWRAVAAYPVVGNLRVLAAAVRRAVV